MRPCVVEVVMVEGVALEVVNLAGRGEDSVRPAGSRDDDKRSNVERLPAAILRRGKPARIRLKPVGPPKPRVRKADGGDSQEL